MSDYDVAIVGRHLATGLLAAILAKNGVRTALIPASDDAAVPAGETTVPYTAELFFLLGNRFGIPEISQLGMFGTLPEQLRATCSVKRSLGFLYHRPGLAQRPEEAVQFNVPGEHGEWHLYRPDVDAHAARLAARYGAVVHDAAPVPGGATMQQHDVEVGLEDGSVVQAEYLVNGSTDPLLRADAMPAPADGRVRHRSNLLYGQLSGVRPFESVVAPGSYRKASPWSAGTLLHAFDGGWVQVVPFGAGFPGGERCSVAVSLDPESGFADPAGRPDEEFGRLIERFPGLREQFAGASPARDWQAWDGWPRWAVSCSGPRWFGFDRGAGRHDFLLSRDVTMSLELVYAAADGLLRLAGSRDWAGDGMKEVADFQAGLFAFYDRLFSAGRTAARDFALWNAYLRVWLLCSILSALSLKRAALDGLAGGDWPGASGSGQVPYWFTVPAGLEDLIADSLADIESVPGGVPSSAAASRIFARLRRARSRCRPVSRRSGPRARRAR
jgi:FADH2 O2-dependent halogenase